MNENGTAIDEDGFADFEREFPTILREVNVPLKTTEQCVTDFRCRGVLLLSFEYLFSFFHLSENV